MFLSQKRIRAISRNNPILDFTKEMHPQSVYLSICLLVHLSIGLSVCLSLSFSVSGRLVLKRNCFFCVDEQVEIRV